MLRNTRFAQCLSGRDRLGAVILAAALVFLNCQIESVISEEFGRDGGAGQGGRVRVGCEILWDSAGREVSASTAYGTAMSRPAHCPDAMLAEPAPAPAPTPTLTATPTPTPAAQRVTPDPVPNPIHVEKMLGNGDADELSFQFDPVGVGVALTSGGMLLWFLRSGFWASLFVMGLPVWRDLDLLPILDRASDDNAYATRDAPDIGAESVFSHEADENEGDPRYPQAQS